MKGTDLLNFEDRLISNIKAFRRHENETLVTRFDKSELINSLRDRAVKNAGIMTENNRIIKEQLMPLLIDPAGLDDGAAEDLFNLALQLFSITDSLDHGLAVTIHERLLEWAELKGGDDLLLRHLYHTGLVKMQIHQNLFAEEAVRLFGRGASYVPHYREIPNRETRMYINRCLGNLYVAIMSQRFNDREGIEPRFFEAVDKALTFWNDPKIRAMDPDFPWDSFISHSHQNICTWIDILRNDVNKEQGAKLASRIYHSLAALTGDGSDKALSRYWPEYRVRYMQLAARYHIGQINFKTLYNGLKELYYTADENDYSESGMYNIIHLSGVILDYLGMQEQNSFRAYAKEKKAILRRMMNYCKNFPNGGDKQILNNYISQFFIHGATELDLDYILKFTSFSQLSTYVHSVQVGNLTEAIASYMIDKKPELFVGIKETTDAAGVMKKKAGLLQLIRRAALCHDIGKVPYMNTVSLCSRFIYDFEFLMIKEHINVGNTFTNAGELIECVRAAIMGHHKWYNGRFGYPEFFDNTKSKYRIIVDMVSVADSIDAATDGIGRSYSTAKNFDEVADEICAQGGMRYSPMITTALEDRRLRDRLRSINTEGRADVYYSAYLDLVSQAADGKAEPA